MPLDIFLRMLKETTWVVIVNENDYENKDDYEGDDDIFDDAKSIMRYSFYSEISHCPIKRIEVKNNYLLTIYIEY